MAKNKQKSLKKRPAKTVKPEIQKREKTFLNTENEYLIRRILDSADSAKIPQSASLFISLLSNLTPSMSELTKREGIRVGRALYNERRLKHYLPHEESVADLIFFFDRAGHDRITYSIFPDRFTLNMLDMHKEYIGMKVHQFEAGIISGFLSASKGEYVEVEEQSCSSDGGNNCTFVTTYVKPETQSKNPLKAINFFANHVINEVLKEEHAENIKETPSYYILSSSAITSRKYEKEMKHISAFIGSQIAFGIFPDPKKAGKKDARMLQKALELISPGKPSVKSLKPIKIDIRFDAIHSNSGLIELNCALLNGMLRYHAVQSAKLTKIRTKAGYIIKI